MEKTLSDQSISALLFGEARAFYQIRTVTETGSTNSDVRELGLSGAPEGLVLIAESQTQGRGRQGRSFYSPKGSGLYMSLLLRPDLPPQEAVLLTAMAGVAAARAVESLLPPKSSHTVRIKWVNDLMLYSRKICGILTESVLSGQGGGLQQAVLGLGFNLTVPERGWPEEIRKIAGAVFGTEASASEADPRPALAAAFLSEFLPLYRDLSQKTFLPEYRSRMLGLGQEILVLQPDGSTEAAEAVDIDDQCRLLVRFPGDSHLTPLGSGEVRIKVRP